MGSSRSISALILAGGNSSRFGAPGPKCLAPLADGSTLLTRTLEQLKKAGIHDATLCCSLENVHSFQKFFRDEPAKSGAVALNVIASAACALGPIPALADALNNTSAEWQLLCLADIFFETNPFVSIRTDAVCDGVLLVGNSIHASSKSGWVAQEHRIVTRIAYENFDGAQTQWTGGFLFRRNLAPAVAAAAIHAHMPLEAWISGLVTGGKRIETISAGNFINVNTPDDFNAVRDSLLERHVHAGAATAR